MCSRFPDAWSRLLAVTTLMVALGGCAREERRFRDRPPTTTAMVAVREAHGQPAGLPAVPGTPNPYESSAYAVSEGKRLFSGFNCVGCHAHGGGGMGPALTDSRWIYGRDPSDIVESILGGRPNGMPSFGGRVTRLEAWQLAAYVRSLSGLLRKDVAPGRDDHMQVRIQEQSLSPREPATKTPRRPPERP